MDSQRLRVVSYNILAEVYARSDLARNALFQHCPENFICSAYRLPLILHELYSYQSDIICLQEVDRWIYEKYLLHGLKYYKNMDSLFLAKRAVQPDPDNPAKMKTDMEKEKVSLSQCNSLGMLKITIPFFIPLCSKLRLIIIIVLVSPVLVSCCPYAFP
ncbi:unnamed protein product [Trichobilharzia regenti]|nr:unnamed protein product [Trichobilharzia regenti]